MGEDGNAHLRVEDEWGALHRGSDIWSIDRATSSTNSFVNEWVEDVTGKWW